MGLEAASDVKPERVSPVFVKFASICAILTGLTTIAVHWLPDLWSNANTFELRVQLQHDAMYMGRFWIVLIHCVLVVISMAAIPTLLRGPSRLIAMFGFGSYVLFAFVEMLRTSLSIFAVNRAWRAGYETSADEIQRRTFRSALDAFGGVNDALFFLFFIAFTAGLFCYGIALISKSGMDQRIGYLFLLWGILNLPGLIDAILGNESLGSHFDWVGRYFQPIARLLIGLWLWNIAERCRAT
jgi:hypothetical protein